MTTNKLKAFNIVAKYKMPQTSTFTIAAEDLEAAKKFFAEMSTDFQDVEIIHVYALSDAPEIEEIIMGKQQTEVVPPSTVN